MSRKLDDLTPECRALAVELLARLCEAGIAVCIVNTLRTPEEQEENIRRGVSWTKNSRHLSGRAIDIAPYDIYQLTGPDKLKWNASDPVWQRIGEIGESVGLVWGGRWGQQPGSTAKPDLGHFEMPL